MFDTPRHMTQLDRRPPAGAAVADASPAARFAWRRRLLLLLAILAVLFAARQLDIAALPGYDLCTLRRTTGLECPTCGFTRGFIALAHGDLATAARLNVLTPPAFLLAIATALVVSCELVAGRSLVTGWLHRHRRWVWAFVAICLAARYFLTPLI